MKLGGRLERLEGRIRPSTVSYVSFATVEAFEQACRESEGIPSHPVKGYILVSPDDWDEETAK